MWLMRLACLFMAKLGPVIGKSSSTHFLLTLNVFLYAPFIYIVRCKKKMLNIEVMSFWLWFKTKTL